MPSIETTSAKTEGIISNIACRHCRLAVPAKIPDPDIPWEGSMKRKPRIDGYHCTASRPAQSGFPCMTSDQRCVYFTDEEGSQPLRHLVSERSDV